MCISTRSVSGCLFLKALKLRKQLSSIATCRSRQLALLEMGLAHDTLKKQPTQIVPLNEQILTLPSHNSLLRSLLAVGTPAPLPAQTTRLEQILRRPHFHLRGRERRPTYPKTNRKPGIPEYMVSMLRAFV